MSGPLVVSIHCPLPLVVKAVKRARELDGYEERCPYPQAQPDRHSMRFVFVDVHNGDIFYEEASGLISQWENENEEA